MSKDEPPSPAPLPLCRPSPKPRTKVQKRLRREMRAALSVADVLLAPTTPFPPFPSCGPPADPASLLLNDVLTVPISLTGVPAVSIPVATTPTARRTTPAVSNSTNSDGSDRGGAGGPGGAEAGVGAAAPGAEHCRLPLGMQVGCLFSAAVRVLLPCFFVL